MPPGDTVTGEGTPAVNSAAGEGDRLPEVTVCICTHKRPALLSRLLSAIAVQRTDGLFGISCVVVDNDAAGSAALVIDAFQSTFPFPLRSAVEPTRNLAVVRNRALKLAKGSYIAFIDDDEAPCEGWLVGLWRTLQEHSADAVLGPVRPYFESQPPVWIVRSRICERPSYPTGSVVPWGETRTGNVLFRAAIVAQDGVWFDPAYALGGEDVDFFRRAARAGKRFVWCEEAPVFELVPAPRLRRRYYLRRAFLQGRVSLKYVCERPTHLGLLGIAAKSAAAIALYTSALPVLFLRGEHVGMKYLIKDCHHIARLLAMLGVSHSARREF